MCRVVTLAVGIQLLVSATVVAQGAVLQESSVVVEGPQLSDPSVAPAIVEEVIPAAPVDLVPVRSIKYNVRPSARRALACHGKTDTVLGVDNPCDGTDCLYAVPVVLPGCCTGEPRVRSRRGLFGRGVVEYTWPGGYEVEVIFRLRGDLAVKLNAD